MLQLRKNDAFAQWCCTCAVMLQIRKNDALAQWCCTCAVMLQIRKNDALAQWCCTCAVMLQIRKNDALARTVMLHLRSNTANAQYAALVQCRSASLARECRTLSVHFLDEWCGPSLQRLPRQPTGLLCRADEVQSCLQCRADEAQSCAKAVAVGGTHLAFLGLDRIRTCNKILNSTFQFYFW